MKVSVNIFFSCLCFDEWRKLCGKIIGIAVFVFPFILNAQTSVPTGNVSGIWTVAGSPYNVNGHITVPQDSTLTIEPGVNVIFQGHYKFNVQGNVLALGTVSDTIVFTAADTSVGWWGLRFNYTPTTQDSSLLIFCKFQNGKANGSGYDASGGGIMIRSFSKIRIENSMILNNTASYGGGIYLNSSSPLIYNCIFSYNYGTGAIYCGSNSIPIINYCDISNNTNVGIECMYSSPIINNNIINGNAQGIHCYYSSPTITNNAIQYNTNLGIYCYNHSSPNISYNNISNNTGVGGGIGCWKFSSPTITNNTISNNSSTYGGGIWCTDFSSPLIENNIISYNTSVSEGGGISCESSSSPTINNNTISNNTVSARGGGIACFSYCSPTITNNTIINNSATGTWSKGGGISCYLSCSPTIIGNTINNNSSDNYGGGISSYDVSSKPNISNNYINNNTATNGGGIYCGLSFIINNIISNNTASSWGGGILCGSSTSIINNIISNNTASYKGGGIACGNASTTITNNTITNNSITLSTMGGGGIYCGSSSPKINNCSIINNYSAGGGGGLMCEITSNPIIKNSIFRGNISGNGKGNSVYLTDSGSDPSFFYCNVEGNSVGFYTNGYSYTGTFTYNIDTNPQFTSPSSGAGTSFDGLSADWTLKNISPSIDKGTPDTSGLNLPLVDLGNNPRTVGCSIDMGAYEFQSGLTYFGFSVASQNILCNGGTTSATVSIFNGTPPYSYYWSNGQTTDIVTGLLAGIYTVTVYDASGCMGIETESITQPSAINGGFFKSNTNCSTPTGSANASFSGGTSPYTYLWSNGATTKTISALAAGTYTITVTDANGCTKTSAVTINNKPSPILTITATQTNCSSPTGTISTSVSGGTSPYSFLWSAGDTTDSLTGLAAGTYAVTVIDANGCLKTDSVSISEMPSVLTSIANSICEGDSIFLQGNYQSTAGTYYDTLQTVNGCDSVIESTLSVLQSTDTTLNETACNSYTLNSQTYISSGTYTQTLANSDGCDSVITLNLTINQSAASNQQLTICNGDSIFLQGNYQSTPGTYYDALQAVNGCDSVIETTISVLQSTDTTLNETACDSYTLNSQTHTSSGTYMQTLMNSNGCDSTITLNLTINQSTINNQQSAICSGDSIFLQGEYQSTPGTYYDTLQTINGCDSVIATTLSILQPTGLTLNETSCDSYTLNSQTYNSSGTYTQTLANSDGCDSTITLSLVINQSTISNQQSAICSGDSIFLQGDYQSAPGTYYDTLQTINGCDSIIATSLSILQPTGLIVNETACDSYTLNSQTYSSSGTYTQTLTNSEDCDSTITLNLTINQSTINTQPLAICSGDSILLQGNYQLTAGTYYDTLQTINGCDSIIATSLSILQPTGSTLTETSCDSYTLNSQTYNSSGTYTQTLTNAEGCDSTITLNLTINQSTINNQQSAICSGDSIFLQGYYQTSPGNYYDTLLSSNECDSIIITALSINSNPAITLSSTPDSGNTSGSASAIALGGFPPYFFEWNTGDTSSSISGLPSSIYFATVTDANGCSATDSVFVDNYVSASHISYPRTQVSIIPNPNDGTFLLEISGYPDTRSQIFIFNIIGEIVYKSSFIQSPSVIRIPGTGVYSLQLISETGIVTRKIIVE